MGVRHHSWTFVHGGWTHNFPITFGQNYDNFVIKRLGTITCNLNSIFVKYLFYKNQGTFYITHAHFYTIPSLFYKVWN